MKTEPVKPEHKAEKSKSLYEQDESTIQCLYILANLRLNPQPENTMYTWMLDDLIFLMSHEYVEVKHGFYVITLAGLIYLELQLTKIERIGE